MVRLCTDAYAYYSDPPIRVSVTLGWDRKTNSQFLYFEPTKDTSEDYSSPLDGAVYNSLFDKHLKSPLLLYYLEILKRYKIFIPIEMYEILCDNQICDPDKPTGNNDKLFRPIAKKICLNYLNDCEAYYKPFRNMVLGLEYKNPLFGDAKNTDEAFRPGEDFLDGSSQFEELTDHLTVNSRCKTRLFLGEADFSFAVAFFRKHITKYPELAQSCTATEFRQEDNLRIFYPHTFFNNISFLRTNGVGVEFGVDAKDLSRYATRRFRCIHFNCPHDGSTYKGRTLPKLIEGFFKNASKLQKVGDKVYMALPQHTDEKSREFRHAYMYAIYEAAALSGYKLVKKRKFDDQRYPGYKHQMTKKSGSASVASQTREFVFRKISEQEIAIDHSDPFSNSGFYEMLFKSPTEAKVFEQGKVGEEARFLLPEVQTDGDSSDCENELYIPTSLRENK